MTDPGNPTGPRWFSRAFARVDPELLPSLLERVRGTPARLEERAAEIPEDLRVVRTDGRWSIQENVGHLGDLEPLWLGRVEDFVAGREALRPADLENTATEQARHNDADMGALLRSFRDQRRRLVAALEDLPDAVARRTALHPRLRTDMTPADLLFFVAEHDDHHLARISEILRHEDPERRRERRARGLFLVLERFRPGCAEAVYRRFTEQGRMLPPGVGYKDSWVDLGSDRCFQLMEASALDQVREWTRRWDDLVEFEIVPVRTSAEAAAAMAGRAPADGDDPVT